MLTNMKKIFTLFYPYMIPIFVLFLCLAVYPLNLIGHISYENASLERGIYPNLDLTNGQVVSAEFTPSKEHLDQISFRFLSGGYAPDGCVTVSIYDIADELVAEETLESGEIMNYRWIPFKLDADLNTDELYRYQISASDYEDASLALYTGSPLIGPEENGMVYYEGIPENDMTIAAIFAYTAHVDKAHALSYDAIILLFGILCFSICNQITKTDKEK